MIAIPVGIGLSNPDAVIRISYPANSTLVVTGYSSGKQYAKDTNTTSSAKAYIFLAPIGNASYILTATNTAGKTVSKRVYATKDQVQSVTLGFELVLFKDGAYQNIGSFNNATITSGNLVMTASGNDGAGGSIHRTFITDVKLDLTNYETLTFSLAEFTINSSYPTSRKVWLGVSSNTIAWQAIPADSNVKAKTVLTNTDQGTNKTVTVDISALTGSFYVFVYEDVYGSTIVSSKSIIIS